MQIIKLGLNEDIARTVNKEARKRNEIMRYASANI